MNWFVRLLNGIERKWIDETSNVKGVDDLETFLAEYLDSTILHYTDGGHAYPLRDTVYVCFEDKADATAYWRDLSGFNKAVRESYWEAQRKAKAEGTHRALVRSPAETRRLRQILKRHADALKAQDAH